MSDARYSLLRRQADMKMAQRLVYKVYAVFLRYANDVYFTPNLRQKKFQLHLALFWSYYTYNLSLLLFALFYPQRNQKMKCKAYMAGVQWLISK